jgi:serine/threonine protein kinase
MSYHAAMHQLWELLHTWWRSDASRSGRAGDTPLCFPSMAQGSSLLVIRRVAHQVLQCLEFLVRQSIVHSDIKPENLLLVERGKTAVKASGLAGAGRGGALDALLGQRRRLAQWLPWIGVGIFALLIALKALCHLGNILGNCRSSTLAAAATWASACTPTSSPGSTAPPRWGGASLSGMDTFTLDAPHSQSACSCAALHCSVLLASQEDGNCHASVCCRQYIGGHSPRSAAPGHGPCAGHTGAAIRPAYRHVEPGLCSGRAADGATALPR